MTISLNGDGTIQGLITGWAPDQSITPADLSEGGPAWNNLGDLSITGKLTVPSTLDVAGDTTLQNLSVTGPTFSATNLVVTGDVVINGTLRSQNAITAGGIIQIKTAVIGPTRQLINSATPVAITGLAINFTPAVATSKILIQAFVSTSATYVASYGIFKNGQPTVSTAGFQNTNHPNMQVTIFNYAAVADSTERMECIPVTHVEQAVDTSMRSYQVYGLSSWSTTNFNLYINNRNNNDMASFSHMIIYEIAQ